MINQDLLMEFLSTVNKLMHDLEKRVGFNYSKNNYHLFSLKEKYYMDIFNLYNRINYLKKDLEHIEIYLRVYPNAKYLAKNNIDKLEYIKYHTEVFFHKIYTIVEVQRLLLNQVYVLGLSEKQCSWNRIKKELGSKNLRALDVVEKYYDSFEHIIEARHLNTHRAIYNDADTDDFSGGLFIYKSFEQLNKEVDDEFKKRSPKAFLEYELKIYRKDRVNFIKQSKIAAISYIDALVNYVLIDAKGIYDAY
jgi:CRISPR/Cas system-associated protein endoribonuclease Cas2